MSSLMKNEMNTVDAFLSHRSFERSGGFLGNWKNKNKPPIINVVLHTKRMPIALWRHGFPKLQVREDRAKGTSKVEVWGGSYNCWEDETVLRKQYYRDRDTGAREVPPMKCPFCRMIEVVRDMVDEGQLDWTAPIFRFEGDEDVRVIHAGGIYNAYGEDDLGDDEKKQLKDAGIKLSEAWAENGMAKLFYVFCVVDVNNVGAGVQIAIEPNLLGDKVKGVINDTMKSLGSEHGNPFLKPYAIQWEHCPNELEFQKKYAARRMELIPISPEIQKLIFNEPPNLKKVLAPFNLQTMRALLEKHCVLPNMPWSHIFDVKVDESEQESEEDFPPQEARGALPNVGAQTDGPVEDVCPECGPGKECPHVACDNCNKPILESDALCKHCGFVFNAAAAPPQRPPPQQSQPRGRARETGHKPPF